MNTITTRRTFGTDGSGGLLVKQEDAGESGGVWSCWIGGVCYGTPRISITRIMRNDSAQVRILDRSIAYAACGRQNWWHTTFSRQDDPEQCLRPCYPHYRLPCPYDARLFDWRTFDALARASRRVREGSPLLDWLREYGCEALPILGQILGVGPIVGEFPEAQYVE